MHGTAFAGELAIRTQGMLLTRIGYYSDFFAYPVLIAVFGAAGVMNAGADGGEAWIASFLGGLAMWTLLEYILHRFVLHYLPYIKEMHEQHHRDVHALVGTPTWLSVVLFLGFVFCPLLRLTDLATASAVSCGLVTGYLWYVSVHHAVHHWHPAHSGYLYSVKRGHAMHHADEAYNFGVTSRFWDRVFRTMRRLR
jgi:sterol desaturase/sphingolipid hydroxylase (fatty acid hydroxylase superfamily)